MKTSIYLTLVFTCVMSCSPIQPALSLKDTGKLESHKVKGRQGILINQKLSFAEFQTSRVKRSWTQGGNTRISVPLISPGVFIPDLISMEYANRHQSFYFQMQDAHGNISDVYGASDFDAADLQIGSNPNSIVNILEDIFSEVDYNRNIFYLQLFLNDEQQPWQLILDNNAVQQQAKKYQGVFAFDRDLYYTLKPITKVQGKKGPKSILMGSVGFEIFNNRNETVAAVSLIDGGMVFLNSTNPKERFLLSNLMAALLLQQDVSETL